MPVTPVRTLLLDIETSPNLGYVWGLWDQNVGLNQLVETTDMMCFSAKWLGDPETMFFSSHRDGHEQMVMDAWNLLSEADAVVHYNGRSFDIKHMNREFVTAGLGPPQPFKQIDLMLAVKKHFRFPSNKLEYVATALGLAGKEKHEGFDLWKKCLAGDPEAWARMGSYNRRDVTLLEELYARILPWISGLPNATLYGGDGCPSCGSSAVEARGYAYTGVSRFPQFHCRDCGSWFRTGRRDLGADLRAVAL